MYQNETLHLACTEHEELVHGMDSDEFYSAITAFEWGVSDFDWHLVSGKKSGLNGQLQNCCPFPSTVESIGIVYTRLFQTFWTGGSCVVQLPDGRIANLSNPDPDECFVFDKAAVEHRRVSCQENHSAICKPGIFLHSSRRHECLQVWFTSRSLQMQLGDVLTAGTIWPTAASVATSSKRLSRTWTSYRWETMIVQQQKVTNGSFSLFPGLQFWRGIPGWDWQPGRDRCPVFIGVPERLTI